MSYCRGTITPNAALTSQVVLEAVDESMVFEKIVWRIIPEASTRAAEMIAGNVDII
ncbi:MAG: peptide/nickel transport system substrate-binding protein, partial [bacterium]